MSEPLLLAPLTIGAMCFPGDHAKAEAFARAQLGDSLLTVTAGRGGGADSSTAARQVRAWLGEDEELWGLLDDGKNFTALLEQAKVQAMDGIVAGYVLSIVLRFASFQYLDNFASVNTAVKVLADSTGKSRAYILQRWAIGRQVSHLWAAWGGLEALNSEPPSELLSMEDGEASILDLLFDEDGFETFLGVAEGFRRAGQRHHAVGSQMNAKLLPAGPDQSLPFDVDDLVVPDFDFAVPSQSMIAAAGAD